MYCIAWVAGIWLEGGGRYSATGCSVPFVGGMEEVLTGAMRIVLGDSELHLFFSRCFPGLFVMLFNGCVRAISLSPLVRTF